MKTVVDVTVLITAQADTNSVSSRLIVVIFSRYTILLGFYVPVTN